MSKHEKKRILHQRERPYNASGRINFTREDIDSDNMTRAFVPRAVFAPIGGRNFLPGIVECTVERINTHDESYSYVQYRVTKIYC